MIDNRFFKNHHTRLVKEAAAKQKARKQFLQQVHTSTQLK